jgi:hypothetical protein
MAVADDYFWPTKVAGERIRIFHVPSKLIKPFHLVPADVNQLSPLLMQNSRIYIEGWITDFEDFENHVEFCFNFFIFFEIFFYLSRFIGIARNLSGISSGFLVFFFASINTSTVPKTTEKSLQVSATLKGSKRKNKGERKHNSKIIAF